MSMFNAPGEGIRPADLVGHLLICRPLQHVQNHVAINGQDKDAVVLDLVVLTMAGPDGTALALNGVSWINTKLIGSLKTQIGRLVLGRMVQGQAKPGQNAPFELQDATNDPAAVAAAEAWVNAHPEFMNRPIPAAQTPVTPPAQPVAVQPVAQPAPVAPIAPVAVAQPVAAPVAVAQPVQPVAPVAAPVAQGFVPGAPVAAPAPVAQPAPAQTIAAMVWDAMQPAQQQALEQQGYTRGA